MLSDDLQISEAIALIWKLTKDEKISDKDKKTTILDFDRVLGLKLNEIKIEEEIPVEIETLAKERMAAKVAKNWAESDRLRDLIKSKGYLVEDSTESYKIRKL